MKLHNYELEKFISFLYGLKLVDYRSRMRSKFIRILTEKYKEYQDDYSELIKEHSKLDKSGSPIFEEFEGKKKYEIQNPSEFQLSYINLLNEEVIVDATEERRNMLLSVKESILNCGKEFEGEEAMLYERWCDLAEEIEYEKG